VSAHVESAYDFDVAVAARADLIAHLPGFWPDAERIKTKGPRIYRISEDAARRAARQGTVVISTVGDVLRENTAPDAQRQVIDVLRWNFDVLKRHGVKIAIGSDEFRSTSVPEALAIAQAGLMTRAEVLQSLSVTTPTAIFPQRAPFGLAEGAPASFIAFDRNPLEDLESITRVSLRVKGGRELHLAR
jgi:imidazolonepropionase-like amidohydrolase